MSQPSELGDVDVAVITPTLTGTPVDDTAEPGDAGCPEDLYGEAPCDPEGVE